MRLEILIALRLLPIVSPYSFTIASSSNLRMLEGKRRISVFR